jgi:hypothetical protein
VKKFLLILSLIITLPIVIFLLYSFLIGFTNDLPKSEKISIAVTLKTGRILAETRNLKFNGWGGSGMNGIKMKAISLTSAEGPFFIEQARELVVYCAEVFLKEINNSEEIRPYLCNYPFTAKNIEVDVFCHDKDDQIVSPPFITCVSVNQGAIEYYIKNPKLQVIYKESYEKALKMLTKEALLHKS